MRQCDRCGTGFEPSNHDRGGYQRFCTSKCREQALEARVYRRKQEERIAALRCRQCSGQITGRVKQFCNPKCVAKYHNGKLKPVTILKTCISCYGCYPSTVNNTKQKYCSRWCREQHQTHPAKKRRSYEPRPDGLECKEDNCSKPVIAIGICSSHYSKKQRKDNPGKEPSGSFRKRAKQWGVYYEPVDRRKIFARNQWICQLCLEPVNPHSTDPRWRASLDHIIPMSRGGAHTYANLQLAHVSCNSRKHANVQTGTPTLPPL